MSTPALESFTVAGPDEYGDATEPVWVSCGSCREGEWFTYRDDGGADRTAPLEELVRWAAMHQCNPAAGAA